MNAIRPWADKIRQTQGAWAVPVAALIALSIPPLAGAEIIILAVGVIWGLAWGFLITIIGTWMGEVLCFYLFKYFFREKAQRIEKSSYMYRQLAEVMRRDGLWMVSIVRFSAIPGHVTTGKQSRLLLRDHQGLRCNISHPILHRHLDLGVWYCCSYIAT